MPLPAFATVVSTVPVNATPVATSIAPSLLSTAFEPLKLVGALIASVPVFVRAPCRLRAPPRAGSLVIVPAFVIGPAIVTLLPEVSEFVSTIAPCAPLAIPELVVRSALTLLELATSSIWVCSEAPIVSDLTVTELVPSISTV